MCNMDDQLGSDAFFLQYPDYIPPPNSVFIRDYINKHVTAAWSVYWNLIPDIQAAAGLITTAFKNGNKLLLCGNGGSAADCQHLAGEFIPMGLPAIALTTDTSAITAIGNDRDFDEVFSKQVEAIGTCFGYADVLLAISTSGKSTNVIKAIEQANLLDMKIIGLTGESGMGGKLCDVQIKVPSTNTQHIQECHLMIEHLIWLLVKETMNADN